MAFSKITFCRERFRDREVEVVERKGIGHPDTICDAVAEQASRALSRYYLDHFGLILHHNVDKVLLQGGRSRPEFGGGTILSPIEIYLAGRATSSFSGTEVPVSELVENSCRQWLSSHLHALDSSRHVRLHTLVRPGSADLVDLYLRQQKTGVALCNDTSCGVGFAPFSELEQIVLAVEQDLNAKESKDVNPFLGEDVKVMALRCGNNIDLTVACALIDRYINSAGDYTQMTAQLSQQVKDVAGSLSSRPITVAVNAADNIDKGSLYLTVTGTSAESGDDGEVGRGNRANGLITPYRPMNMEAVAGKNPVTHVGKLYNVVAQNIATALVDRLETVEEAACFLVSRIGSPVSQPRLVDIKVYAGDGRKSDRSIQDEVDEIVQEHLDLIGSLADQLIEGKIPLY